MKKPFEEYKNCKIKYYPNGATKITCFNDNVYNTKKELADSVSKCVFNLDNELVYKIYNIFLFLLI